ncbi:metal ABC transporter ATP-binding protein [Plantibacter flavus]|uniref:zinc ABC transporter ATP-binding protein AztA n=1 Tax=Plantibacter flavus TaxID=150123 RepID=UPI003F17C9E5
MSKTSAISVSAALPSDRSPSGSIHVRDVSAHHAGTRVLHRVSADIPSASITAITGANGAGKSTLLSAIAGLQPIVGGAVEGVSGRSLAFVPQRSAVPEHFPVTVREVVSMGRWPRLRSWWSRFDVDDVRVVSESLDRLGVADLAARTFGELSGGERQRVLVAQALAREAEVVLLDEPTVGLDRVAARAIRRVLRAEADRGAVVVEVTHDAVAMADADVRLHLEAGRLLPSATGGRAEAAGCAGCSDC